MSRLVSISFGTARVSAESQETGSDCPQPLRTGVKAPGMLNITFGEGSASEAAVRDGSVALGPCAPHFERDK